MGNKQPGVTQWSFSPRHMDAARQAVEHGFGGLHFEVGNDLEPLHGSGLREFKDFSEGAGLELIAGSLNFLDRIKVGPVSQSPQLGANVSAAIETCVSLGVLLVSVPFFGASEIKDEDGLKRAAEFLGSFGRKAGEQGIEVMVECSLDGPRLLELLKAADVSTAKVLLDVQNLALWHVGLDEYAELLRDRLGPFIHLKDGSGGVMANRHLGEGEAGIAGSMPLLLGLRKKIVIENEYAEFGLDPARDIEFLKTLAS